MSELDDERFSSDEVPLPLVTEPEVLLPHTATSFDDEDVGKFEKVWQAALPTLLRRRWNASIDADDVDDLLQEARITAFQRCPIHKDTGAATRWIGVIYDNICLAYFRKKKRRDFLHAAVAVLIGPDGGIVDVSDDEREATAWVRERHIELALHSLDKLTHKQRTVVKLHVLEGLSAAEVASKMSCKTTTVRAVKFQALEKLRKSALD